MPEAPIPFGPRLESSSDELSGASPVATNVIADPRGVMRARPGLALVEGLPSGVVDASGLIGLWRTRAGATYAIGATASPFRRIFRLHPGGGAVLGASPDEQLRGTGLAQFAETEALLVLAGGSTMQEVLLSTDASQPMEADSPEATHVLVHSSRLLGNNTETDRTKVQYSGITQGTLDLSGHRDWTPVVDGPGAFTAEARADAVVALGSTLGEVWVWCQTHTELWGPDASLTWARVALLESGCGAPYSPVQRDGVWYWIDAGGRIVTGSGREVTPISGPVDQLLRSLDTSDAFGWVGAAGFFEALCWTFPTAGLTLAYQPGVGWARWDFAPGGVPGCAHLTQLGGETLIGTTGGRVLGLDELTSDDAGSAFTSRVETGFLDRGTDAAKLCNSVRFVFRRLGPGPATGLVQYRNDLGPWSAPLVARVGDGTDSDPVLSWRGLGMYRRRQWRFTWSGPGALGLVRATEEWNPGLS